MVEHHGRRVVVQAAAHHFPRMNAGAVDGAEEHLLGSDEAQPRVQQHDAEHFPLVAGHAQRDVAPQRGGLQRALALLHPRQLGPLQQLAHGQQRGHLAGAEPMHLEQPLGALAQHAVQAAEAAQQGPGQGQRILAAVAGAQHQRYQLRFSQRIRPGPQQPLPGPFLQRHFHQPHHTPDATQAHLPCFQVPAQMPAEMSPGGTGSGHATPPRGCVVWLRRCRCAASLAMRQPSSNH